MECIICSENLKFEILLPCNHSCLCLKCFQTMKVCHKQNQCPICQKDFQNFPIILNNFLKKKYEELKNEELIELKEFEVFINDLKIEEILKSFNLFKCPKCENKSFLSFKQIKNHLFEHNMKICPICFNSNRFLNSEIPIIKKNLFKNHKKIHPNCLCCDFIAFDNAELTEHMLNNHFRCDICALKNKILWFKNISEIQVHFHENHFACKEDICISHGFIVFETLAELQLHQIKVHDKKIDIDMDISFKNNNNNIEEEIEKQILIRRKESRNRLTFKVNEIFKNQHRVNDLFNLIENLNRKRISAEVFFKQYINICGKLNSELLFCDTISTISDPKIRSILVRIHDGIRKNFKPQKNIEKLEENNFPSLNNELNIPQKKKSNPWNQIKI